MAVYVDNSVYLSQKQLFIAKKVKYMFMLVQSFPYTKRVFAKTVGVLVYSSRGGILYLILRVLIFPLIMDYLLHFTRFGRVQMKLCVQSVFHVKRNPTYLILSDVTRPCSDSTTLHPQLTEFVTSNNSEFVTNRHGPAYTFKMAGSNAVKTTVLLYQLFI